MLMTRKTPRVQNSTVYLGVAELRLARESRLDAIAGELDCNNRSELIQKIADGELVVIRKPSQPEQN